jgi:hypothetical protein
MLGYEVGLLRYQILQSPIPYQSYNRVPYLQLANVKS